MSSYKNATVYYPYLILIFFSLIALALVAPISAQKYVPNLPDYINHLAAIIQSKSALAEGQFPLRIMPLEQFGFRYPYYQFYSSTTFTLAGFLYTYLFSNPLVVYKSLLWLGLFLAGFYMYKLAFWLVKSEVAAVLTSMVYLTTPYYIINVCHLGNLSETIALGIIPAVVYYSYQRYFFRTNKTLVQMSLCWYALLTVHMVSFVYTSFFLGLFLLLITIRHKRRWVNLFSVGIGYLYALLLGMWFLAPIVEFSQYFKMITTFADINEFVRYSPLLSYLLFPGVGSAIGQTLGTKIQPAIGWPLLMGAVVCLWALVNRNVIGKKRADYLIPVILVLFVVSFILVWSPINFWNWMPSALRVGQYSWRILNPLIWLGALLFAWAIMWVFNNQLDRRHLIVGMFIIVMTANVWFPKVGSVNLTVDQFKQNPVAIYNENAYSIDFYKNTQFVDKIDTMILYSLVSHSVLNLNVAYLLPRALLETAVKPEIFLEGSIPANLAKNNVTLAATLNGKLLSQTNLKSGGINWRFALPQRIDNKPGNPFLNLAFALKKNDKTNVKIPVKGVLLTGFLNKDKVINVNVTKQSCKLQGTTTLCSLFVPNSKDIVELPIIYYPNLMTVHLNGQQVPYQSILYYDSLLATIKPIHGMVNQIKIEFTGLKWANWTSLLFWLLWLGLVVASLKTSWIKT